MPKALSRVPVAIVSHVFTTGPAQALQEYLRRKGCGHIFIGHPFLMPTASPSFLERSPSHGVTHRIRGPHPLLSEPYRYLVDFLVTLWWLARFGPVDVLVGCGNLNALAGLVMRRFGKVQRVVFYAIDYVPDRFHQRALNTVYHLVERMCARHSDWVWNLSPAMIDARAEADLRAKKAAPQLVVPMGGGFDLALRPRLVKDPATIAFVGHLLDKQGVQIALQALPEVLLVVPEARLLVMGTGPYESALKSLAVQLGVHTHVEFTGYVEDFSIVQGRLAASTVGIALFIQALDRWTKFADPGKIKDYLAAALPIITTTVPPVAEELARRGAGVIVEPSPPAVAAALIALLTDRAALERAAGAASILAQEFDWNRIFDTAFQSSVGAVR